MPGTNLSVTIPEEQLNQLLGRAIIDSLSEESKNQIIGAAVQYLNKPQGESYRTDRTTPLQDIFNAAVRKLATTLVDELVRESPHFATVRDEVKEQLDRYPSLDNDTELQVKIATTIMDHARTVKSTY